MIIKMTFCYKFILTEITLELSLILMASHVNFQISFLGKRFLTVFALKWLNTLMFTKMYQQSRFLRISLMAYTASERFDVLMVEHMSL